MLKYTIKQIVFIILLIAALATGFWILTKSSLFEAKQTESATIMLEKIKTVTKLISVEGQFSELYDYKETYDYDFFNLFSKKILVRVTAKVSVGYDFEKVNISIDSLAKTVTLNELPEAEILSIDHDLDYYDISEGTFNRFTNQEYNMINKKAKDFIATKAKTTNLLSVAENQKEEYIKMMEMALKSGGWSLVIKYKQPSLN